MYHTSQTQTVAFGPLREAHWRVFDGPVGRFSLPHFIPNKLPRPNWPTDVGFFGGWWLLIMLLVVAQDYGYAWYWGKAFYWSECLLFNSYWLWFLPLTLLWSSSFTTLRSSGGKLTRCWWKGLVGAAVLSVLHLTLFALWVDWASSVWLDFHFQFAKLWPRYLTQEFYQGVVVFGLVWGMLHYRGGVRTDSPAPERVELAARPIAALTIRVGTKEVRVPTASIDWLAKDGAYVRLHCGSKQYLKRITLQRITEQLGGGAFVRIHRSLTVNLERVRSFRSRRNGDYDLVLVDGTVLRLSRRYRERVLPLLRTSDRPDVLGRNASTA